ncbi:DUF192 domain-containing protein [Stutzerimonas nitrititolerans]|uniref:DUF192 domain-containing protein n=1 Tax=Stutzerimonas nitrititolerans TaxID=2482751 RepID=UPI0028AECAE0|nr:DUF192 domain-containing protein [Stutzerimonas nitrititolerans]
MNAQVIHRQPGRAPTPLRLEHAATPWSRLRGLLGRRGLAAASGLWISPCNSVHCCFMRFAIDVLYLDGEQRILHIRHALRPWRFSACWRARSVVELAAGECRRLNIQPGDRLQCNA